MMELWQLGGRRFIVTVGCGIVTSFLMWHGRISDGMYATIIIATVGAYITGSTAQQVVESKVKDATRKL